MTMPLIYRLELPAYFSKGISFFNSHRIRRTYYFAHLAISTRRILTFRAASERRFILYHIFFFFFGRSFLGLWVYIRRDNALPLCDIFSLCQYG